MPLHLPVELDLEVDGRWIAEVPAIPGATVYGSSPEQALEAARQLATDVIEDRLMRGEPLPELNVDADVLTMVVASHVATVVRGTSTSLFVGYVDGMPGAHTQAESLDELFLNLSEVIALAAGSDSAPENLPEERLSAREN